MYTLLILVEIIISILLTIVILMQSSKGGGLAGTFAGGSMGSMFGVRRTADFLSKATGYLAAVFIALCLVINLFFLPTASRTGTESVLQSGTPTTTPRAVPPTSQPAATPTQQTPTGK
jgi:preprotein translocase subunit SecG